MTSHRSAPWLVILAGIVAAMHAGKLPPTLPVLQQQLGLGLGQSGFLLAAIQAAGIACALFIGLMANKLGLKRLLVGGLLVLAGAGVLEAASQGFASLFLSRLLEGLGFLSVVLVAPALLRQLVAPERLKTMLGFWAAYMGLGVATSLMLVPALLSYLSWPQVWLLYVVLALVVAGCLWWQVPDGMAAGGGGNSVALRQLLRSTLRHPAPWLLGVVFACYTSQWFAVTGFLPTVYAHAQIGLKQAGMLTALVCLSNVIGPIVAGFLLQHGRTAVVLLGSGFVAMMLGSVLAFAGMGVWPFGWQFAGVLLFSAGGGLIPGVVFAYSVYLAPNRHAVASTMGWVQEWSVLGQFCLPPLLGNLVVWWGSWRHAWVISVVLGVVGMLCSWQIQRLIRRLPPTSGL